MYSPRAAAFKIGREQTEEDANAFPHGNCDILQIVDTAVTQVKYNMSLTVESFDSNDMSYLMDEQISTSRNIALPDMWNGVIPPALTIPVPGLLANQAISVTVLDSLQQTRQLRQVPGTPGAGQYSVAAGAVNFNAAQANMPVNIMYDKVFDELRGIGLETTYLKWGKVAFKGVVCGTRFPKPMKIFIPGMIRTGNWDLSIGGQKTSVELTFRLQITPPYRSPVIFYDL
ncbi:MAG TPA: hypothetical protein VIQ31_38595 [Phormidium sp.]